MREIALPGFDKAILSDTVGFISDLPTQLVAAFRATLEEVVSADLIVHVRDISHPDSDAQRADVEQVLAEIGAGEAVRIEAWNKIDLLGAEEAARVRAEAARREDVAVLSALSGEGVEPLLAARPPSGCARTSGAADASPCSAVATARRSPGSRPWRGGERRDDGARDDASRCACPTAIGRGSSGAAARSRCAVSVRPASWPAARALPARRYSYRSMACRPSLPPCGSAFRTAPWPRAARFPGSTPRWRA